MTYKRVMPRDLFNEANLLKCYGKLWLHLERHPYASLDFTHGPEEFMIYQYPDGDIAVGNVQLVVGGTTVELRRPINSREDWPLYGYHDDHEYEVFTDAGQLHNDFLALLSRLKP